ncbi:MAG: mechanosensitive ion channel domain-containing protein [Georgfuchsia sp.]
MTQPDLPGWIADFLGLPLLNIGASPVTVGRLLSIVAIVIAVWWFASAMERTIMRTARRSSYLTGSTSSVFAWARIARYTVWIAGTIFGLGMIGVDLTSIAVLGGAVGIGIGFGLQNIVSNFVSGVTLLIEHTLKVGDFVDLESGVRGHVREISLRYTRIATNDDVDVIVPNSEFINGRVINWTYETRMRRLRVPFSVAYGTDKNKVKEAVLRAAGRVEGTVEERPADVWLVRFGDNGLEFELVVWVGADRVARPGNTTAAYLWAIDDELRAENIEIPFPQRDMHLRTGAISVRLDKSTDEPPSLL